MEVGPQVPSIAEKHQSGQQYRTKKIFVNMLVSSAVWTLSPDLWRPIFWTPVGLGMFIRDFSKKYKKIDPLFNLATSIQNFVGI